MKTFKVIQILVSGMILLLVLSTLNDAFCQKKGKTRVRAYYQKLDNNNIQLRALLTVGSGKNMMGVIGAQIEVQNIVDDEQVLAVIETDTEGEAVLQIESGYPLTRNENGYAELNFVFSGNDTLRKASRDLEFKDLILKPTFKEEDSVKIIRISAYEDSAGVKLPVPEIKINIGVRRLLSVLNLATIETRKNGVAEFEFPNDIPGDSIGNLQILIKIDDDRDFGTVISKSNVKWGTIVDYNNPGNGRSLFGDEAPLWMIIAVFIVLGGAWYHFIWAIIKVWGIKKEGTLDTN